MQRGPAAPPGRSGQESSSDSWLSLSSRKTRWAFSLRAFFYGWPATALPFRNRLFVSFQGASFRLLTRPVQAGQQSADVGPVVLHAEFSLDDLGNARGGPKVGAISPGQGPFLQQLRQLL